MPEDINLTTTIFGLTCPNRKEGLDWIIGKCTGLRVDAIASYLIALLAIEAVRSASYDMEEYMYAHHPGQRARELCQLKDHFVPQLACREGSEPFCE